MQNFFAEMCSYKIQSLTLNVNYENVFLQKNLISKITKKPFLMKNFEHDHFNSIINLNLPKIAYFILKINTIKL